MTAHQRLALLREGIQFDFKNSTDRSIFLFNNRASATVYIWDGAMEYPHSGSQASPGDFEELRDKIARILDLKPWSPPLC